MINIPKILKGFFKLKKHKGSFKEISWLKTKILKHENDNKLKSLKIAGYHIWYKKPYEILHTYNDIFIQEFYKFNSDKINPIIIDCGSNIGLSILYFKKLFTDAKIIGFEPDKDNFEILVKNINKNKLESVIVEKKAVWINNEKIEFEEKGTEASKINTSNTTSNNSVDCIRLKDLIDRFEEIDFLKIDIEGAEFEVILDCQNSLKKVKNIFLEYHGKIYETTKLNKLLTIVTENNFNVYIKNAADILENPFFNKKTNFPYDVQLNIFCYK